MRRITSARSASKPGRRARRTAASRSGTARMVRTFSVTPSPRTPSPRVDGAGEHAVLVDHLEREPVELGLDDVGHAASVAHRLAQPLVEAAQRRLRPCPTRATASARRGRRWGRSRAARRPRAGVGESGVTRSGCASSSAAQLGEERVVGLVRDLRRVAACSRGRRGGGSARAAWRAGPRPACVSWRATLPQPVDGDQPMAGRRVIARAARPRGDPDRASSRRSDWFEVGEVERVPPGRRSSVGRRVSIGAARRVHSPPCHDSSPSSRASWRSPGATSCVGRRAVSPPRPTSAGCSPACSPGGGCTCRCTSSCTPSPASPPAARCRGWRCRPSTAAPSSPSSSRGSSRAASMPAGFPVSTPAAATWCTWPPTSGRLC